MLYACPAPILEHMSGSGELVWDAVNRPQSFALMKFGQAIETIDNPYADDEQSYSYDTNVPNHLNLAAGAICLVVNRKKKGSPKLPERLVVIERIRPLDPDDTFLKKKYLCPNQQCATRNDVRQRHSEKDPEKRYRCPSCKMEFGIPEVYYEPVRRFRAEYSEDSIDVRGIITEQDLDNATKRPGAKKVPQHAIRTMNLEKLLEKHPKLMSGIYYSSATPKENLVTLKHRTLPESFPRLRAGLPRWKSEYVHQPEAALQKRFAVWWAKVEKCEMPGTIEFRSLTGARLVPDMWIAEPPAVFEVKVSLGSREPVRTAIGQVLDYQSVARDAGHKETSAAIVLDKKPATELVKLIRQLGIRLYYETDESFVEVSNKG
jgi:hypothetical protein